jgi:hypothetical protein
MGNLLVAAVLLIPPLIALAASNKPKIENGPPTPKQEPSATIPPSSIVPPSLEKPQNLTPAPSEGGLLPGITVSKLCDFKHDDESTLYISPSLKC